MSTHPIVHIELPSSDPKAASAFYADTFGWTIKTDPTFDYTMFQAAGGPGGGFVGLGDEHEGGQAIHEAGKALLYIGTDDIDESLRKVQEHGGTVIAPKMEIPQTGWFAVFRDPVGNRMALFTPMEAAS